MIDWNGEILPMTLYKFHYGRSYDWPLAGMLSLYGWKNLPKGAAVSIYRNAKRYFDSLLERENTRFVKDVANCALRRLSKDIPETDRASIGKIPLGGLPFESDFERNNFPRCASWTHPTDLDLEEFALQHASLSEVLSAETRYAIFYALVKKTQFIPFQHGKLEKSVKYKEWKSGAGQEVRQKLADMRARADTMFDVNCDDFSALMPFFSGHPPSSISGVISCSFFLSLKTFVSTKPLFGKEMDLTTPS